MSNISPDNEARRESARKPDGKFGSQEYEEAAGGLDAFVAVRALNAIDESVSAYEAGAANTGNPEEVVYEIRQILAGVPESDNAATGEVLGRIANALDNEPDAEDVVAEVIRILDPVINDDDPRCERCGRRLVGAESDVCLACIKAAEHADDSYKDPMCPGCGQIRFSSDVAAGVCRDCGWPNEKDDEADNDPWDFAGQDIKERGSIHDLPPEERNAYWLMHTGTSDDTVTGPFLSDEEAADYIGWAGLDADGFTVVDGQDYMEDEK